MQDFTNTRFKGFFLISSLMVVATLYFARAVLVPLSLSILISFVLGPMVARMEKMGLNRVPSVLVVTLLSFSMLGALGFMCAQQVTDLARDLPSYSDNLREKIKSLKPSRDGVISGLKNTVQEIKDEIAEPVKPESSLEIKKPLEKSISPISTKPVESPYHPFELLQGALTPMLAPLTTTGIVIVLVIFILIQREDLRNRFIRLIGEERLTLTTEALNDATQKVSKYLSLQLVVNVIFGISVATGLYLMDVPNAFLWGFLSIVLRFLPYIGVWIAACLPILFSLAISPGWTQPLLVLGLFMALELIVSNLVEPFLFSRNTGLSPISVLLSAVFWTWLWGGIGLFLATPLTVCLVVVGRYVPGLEFITIIFGDTPALQLHARLYQRLLARDQEEATNITYDFLKTEPVEHLYEELILPALNLSEQDRQWGRVDDSKQILVRSSLREIIDEVEDLYWQSKLQGKSSIDSAALYAEENSVGKENVIDVGVLSAHSEADEICAILVSNYLSHQGIKNNLIAELGSDKTIDQNSRMPLTVAVISAMPSTALSHIRRAIKAIRRHSPHAKIIIGLWSETGSLERIKERLALGVDDQITTSFSKAVDQCKRFARSLQPESAAQSIAMAAS